MDYILHEGKRINFRRCGLKLLCDNVWYFMASYNQVIRNPLTLFFLTYVMGDHMCLSLNKTDKAVAFQLRKCSKSDFLADTLADMY